MERDEKRIWHLQSQVLRELTGSEVHAQAGRHTLKFQSPENVLSPLSAPSLLQFPFPALSLYLELAVLSLRGCTVSLVTLTSDSLCPLSFHSEWPLHGAQGLRLSPVLTPDLKAETASGLDPRPPTFHFLIYFMQAGGEARVLAELGKGTRRGPRLVQDVIILCPDITGLSSTRRGLLCLVCELAFLLFLSYTAKQQAHTLQAAIHWHRGSGSHREGVAYLRVFVPELRRGQVCVCVGGSRALGTESGSLLTATVAATLATQEEKMCWMSEWERDLQ